MSNETKQDVFDEVRHVALQDETLLRTANIHVLLKQDEVWRSRYDAALPDDLPVIPKDVSEWLTWCKMSNHSLKDALDGETRVSEDAFARAWVLGAWKVEETGEIVKLEAEK
jgi:hypothetical protein